MAFVGLVIGVGGYVTTYRRWPDLIAGFDPGNGSDVDGLTRRVGGIGVGLGGVCLGAAGAAPQHRGVVSALAGLVIVVGTIVTATGCGRFTRRSVTPLSNRRLQPAGGRFMIARG